MSTQTFKGVLFDLDGTLLDTADDLGAALNHVLEQHELPTVSEKQYRDEASNGANALLSLGFGDHLEKFDLQELRQMLLDYYERNIAEYTKLFTGVVELIRHIEINNIPWGIVTNKPGFLTEPLVSQFELFSSAGSVVSGDTLSVAKPHPDPLLHAAQALGVEANSILYVGDAERDIDAGQRARMTTCIASWGYIGQETNTEAWSADFDLKTPQELIKLL